MPEDHPYRKLLKEFEQNVNTALPHLARTTPEQASFHTTFMMERAKALLTREPKTALIRKALRSIELHEERCPLRGTSSSGRGGASSPGGGAHPPRRGGAQTGRCRPGRHRDRHRRGGLTRTERRYERVDPEKARFEVVAVWHEERLAPAAPAAQEEDRNAMDLFSLKNDRAFGRQHFNACLPMTAVNAQKMINSHPQIF